MLLTVPLDQRHYISIGLHLSIFLDLEYPELLRIYIVLEKRVSVVDLEDLGAGLKREESELNEHILGIKSLLLNNIY